MANCSLKNSRKFFDATFRGRIPVLTQWKTAYSTLLVNSGPSHDFENFRVIMINSAPAKSHTKLLFSYLERFVQKMGLVNKNQHAARGGRSCADDIFLIQQPREKQCKRQKPLFLIFLDFSKVLDRVIRTFLFHILRLSRIPEVLVRVISALYEDRAVKIRVKEVVTHPLSYQHEFIQGDALSPLLFTILVDYVLRSLNSMDSHGELAEHSAFVDDFLLIAETDSTAQRC